MNYMRDIAVVFQSHRNTWRVSFTAGLNGTDFTEGEYTNRQDAEACAIKLIAPLRDTFYVVVEDDKRTWVEVPHYGPHAPDPF